MKLHARVFGLVSLLAVFSAGGWAASDVSRVNEVNQVPSSVKQKVDKLRADLEARGYEVLQGSWNLFTIDDCKYAIQSMGTCMGNNPTAPYVIPSVPLWPDEFADQHMKGLIGPTADDTWWTHRFDPKEAIVVIGLMPPPGRYFGLQTYSFTREGSLNTSDNIYQAATDAFLKNILFLGSPNPDRQLVFASLGESNNNVVIQQQSGGSFNQERSFIITPDQVMQSEMTDALVRAGVPDRNQIFTEPVSTDIAHIGLGSEADDFMTVFRYALPDDATAGDQWRHQLPLVILRVRDKNAARAPQPYPAPALDVRIARSELGLTGDVDNLVQAVKQRWGQLEAPTGSFASLRKSVDLIGRDCLQRPMDCLGDSGDADYQVSPTEGLDSGQVLAVVGTLGTATGNATYTSLSVNWLPPLVGVVNLSDTDLAGSASSYSSTVANTEKFYVEYFSRDCTGLKNCVTVTKDMVPVGNLAKVIQRNYVVPGGTRGPDPAQVLNPTMIVLKGNQRPANP